MKPEHAIWIEDLIAANNWAAFDYDAHPNKTVSHAVRDLIASLPADEAQLALELLDDYLIIKDYRRAARELMQLIQASVGNARTFISPVRDFSATSTKSGQALHYDMRNFTALFAARQVEMRDDPRSAECQAHEGPHVAVDDFIGTGGQFITMRDKILEQCCRFPITHVAVVCIQEQAFERLTAEGLTVLALEVRPKAMPHLAAKTGRNVKDLYAAYDTIEAKAAPMSRARRGWDASEALVTLKSTPNNTLPIFWTEGKAKWPAPFPRPKR